MREESKEWLRLYLKLWKENNPEKVKTQRMHEKVNYRSNILSKIKHNVNVVAYNRKIRELVIMFYGGKCQCCGEDKFEFLAIDHIDGWGSKHRKEIGEGRKIANWIYNHNFPDGFRVLCHNCNMAISFYGNCPHIPKG